MHIRSPANEVVPGSEGFLSLATSQVLICLEHILCISDDMCLCNGISGISPMEYFANCDGEVRAV
jgi:hypothetical protein